MSREKFETTANLIDFNLKILINIYKSSNHSPTVFQIFLDMLMDVYPLMMSLSAIQAKGKDTIHMSKNGIACRNPPCNHKMSYLKLTISVHNNNKGFFFYSKKNQHNLYTVNKFSVYRTEKLKLALYLVTLIFIDKLNGQCW